ncbi:tetratricopeptide repeat protein [Cupriavidus sp. 2TAF22]|uniref:tetratricopeptide repeat protein n=1 Tax=unclassified Cupriavidus TaxID=2640874 RepID=UPI003F92A63A
MKLVRVLLTTAALLLSVSCLAQEASTPSALDTEAARLLQEGSRLAIAGKRAEAIEDFDKVSAMYESALQGSKVKLFSARFQPEALFYLVEASNAKTPARVVSGNWAYAYYMKGYVLVELGRLADAKVSLQQAIDLAPHNSQFLAELASVYQREKDWSLAMKTFQAAETQAREFSPPALKNAELSRAWRGQGYVYVEQHQLAEAEALYRKCLELDASDTRAANELRFIQAQRAKQDNRAQ